MAAEDPDSIDAFFYMPSTFPSKDPVRTEDAVLIAETVLIAEEIGARQKTEEAY